MHKKIKCNLAKKKKLNEKLFYLIQLQIFYASINILKLMSRSYVQNEKNPVWRMIILISRFHSYIISIL